MDKELRKNQSILRQSGTAVIIFEIWNVIKFVAYSIHNPASIQQYIDQLISGNNITSDVATILTVSIMTTVIMIDFVLRFFIGKNAIAASKDKKYFSIYIFVAILLFIFSVYSVVYEFFTVFNNTEALDYMIMLIIDLSSIFVLLELIIAAFKIKHIKRKMTE